MLEKLKQIREWFKRKAQSIKEWFKEKPWGIFVAQSLAFITTAGLVIGITYASGGQALWFFIPNWAYEAWNYKEHGSTAPHLVTASTIAILAGFYQYIGESIYNAIMVNADVEQQPLLDNNSFSEVRSLGMNNAQLLSTMKQTVSTLDNTKLVLEEEEKRQESELPPVVPFLMEKTLVLQVEDVKTQNQLSP